MANTTFSGPVRSEGGFVDVTKSTTTGAITNNAFYDDGLYVSQGAHMEMTASTTAGPANLIVGKQTTKNSVVVDPYTSSATALFELGTRLHYGDRVYRYAYLGGSGVTAGKVVASAAHQGAHHKDMAITANVAAGVREISIETNGTNLVANEYKDGYLYVNDGTGEGQMMKIASHPAHVHGTDPSVVITTYDPVVTAITQAGTQVTIHKSKYYKVIVAPHAETSALVGVTPRDIPADHFFWVQTTGPMSVLTNGTVVVGNACVRSGASIAGAVAPASDNVLQEVGQVMVVNANTEYSLIDLMLE